LYSAGVSKSSFKIFGLRFHLVLKLYSHIIIDIYIFFDYLFYSHNSISRAAVKSKINIYAKQKKDDIVDVIFSEVAGLDLSDMISNFIADRFNHLRTVFTVPQLHAVCVKVNQLSRTR
jgi:hypothetical protein